MRMGFGIDRRAAIGKREMKVNNVKRRREMKEEEEKCCRCIGARGLRELVKGAEKMSVKELLAFADDLMIAQGIVTELLEERMRGWEGGGR